MLKKNYNVLGVMSGTSLDGIDLAYIHFITKGGQWHFEIKDAVTVSYSREWHERLKTAVDESPAQLKALDKEYTLLLAEVINNFIDANGIQDVDAVCSHGHTVLHQPEKGITLQIGNLPELATLTARRVVCNFRIQDVGLGGQGAPLVPAGDRLLFGSYSYCLNLGGFSNISFEEGGKRAAFDICPVNTVLNFYAARLGQEYDDGGSLAKSGKLNAILLNKLNALEYYNRPYPKSLGFEYVKGEVLPLMEQFNLSDEDKLRTYTEHIAIQITKNIADGFKDTLLVTGGGAYNTFLLQRIKELLRHTDVTVPDDKTIQYKEALIFGLLGVLRLRGEANVLSSVTGAAKDHVAGFVYEP